MLERLEKKQSQHKFTSQISLKFQFHLLLICLCDRLSLAVEHFLVGLILIARVTGFDLQTARLLAAVGDHHDPPLLLRQHRDLVVGVARLGGRIAVLNLDGRSND